MIAIGAYAAFLVLATVLAVKVGFMLMRHGDVLPAGGGEPGPAAGRMRSVGGLVVLGFWLVAAGAVMLLSIFGAAPQSVPQALMFLAWRLGVLLVVLGVTQFNCLSILAHAAGTGGRPHDAAPAGPARLRRAREDPLDRVFEAARLDAPSGL